MAKLTPNQQKLLNSLSMLRESTIDELEKLVNEKWGSSQFDWTLGRSGGRTDTRWFWFCGEGKGKASWLHSGYANTISEALQAMLSAEK